MAEKKKDTKKKAVKKKAPAKKKAVPKKKTAPKKEAPVEKEEEAPQEEIVEAEVIEIVTKSQDEEVFAAMDYADEEMVLAELQGRSEALEHYVYSFTDKDGKLITGLSLSGTREAARALALASLTNPGLVQPTIPDPPLIIQETPEYMRVQATALDQRTGFRWHGFVEQEKFYLDRETKEAKPRKFAFVIATSKAQRNALRGLLPEHWIIEMIKTYVDQGKIKSLDVAREPGLYVLPKGKHKGLTIEEVYEQAPDYLKWAVENWTDQTGQLIRKYLDQLQADKTPEVLDDGETIKYKGKIIKADSKITSDWYDGLRKLVGEAEMHGSHLKNHLKKHYGVTSTAHLTFGQAIPFRQYLEERIAKGGEEPEEPEEEESDLNGSEPYKPYAMTDEILELAGEITREGFNFEEFTVEHIAPHMEIDENVQKLLFQFLQRLGELEEDEDMGPLTKAFDKGIEQLIEED